ncbi:hypothetical protein [Nocardioides massiliensis]|uniref:SPW repeat-containing protein n=1 Tax=Nocardioides massiliensis TaxID=1325935 RepID=A0ABT9NPD4_9ACTN|nr:hypothetical protein [Nocardioides massiliensis]MDP9822265.1 hypothetical protein [Nocardioides massiliensis]
MTTTPAPVRTSLTRHLAWGIGLAVVAAIAWFGWMGWDSEYWYDEAGDPHGPYETWQVAGCVLTLLVACVLGAALWRPLGPMAVMPPAFTAAWIATSASGDDQGLWPVGALFVLVGTVLGAGLVGIIVGAFDPPSTRRRRHR